jgi:hypothetical protein
MGSSEDDRVLREMLTPNLDEALEALGYWIQRWTRLPFHRRAARREAKRMIELWQARAISGVRRAPVALILSRRTVTGVARLAVAYHVRRILARVTTVAVAFSALVAVVILAGR